MAGISKSPLTTRLLELKQLVNLTLSMEIPWESLIPVPSNCKIFYPSSKTTGIETWLIKILSLIRDKDAMI